MLNGTSSADLIPARAGVGLKPEHFQTLIDTRPDVGWFEIHPENYFGPGGPLHHYLEAIRQHYPLSLHGVGLSLGSADGVSSSHLQALKQLANRYQPGLISEHLSWSRWQDVVLNDLLPVPYTDESLDILTANIHRTQEALGRQILLENPSSYLQACHDTWNEAEFLVTLAQRSGAGILLDVNNVYVSACNHGMNAHEYIRAIPPELVGEIHLAGHSVQTLNASGPEEYGQEECGQDGGKEIRIDDHGSPVCDEVWALYEFALGHIGPVPTLIERDTNIPAWPVLYDEARQADRYLRHYSLNQRQAG